MQVLLVALLFGFAIMTSKGASEATVKVLDELSQLLFKIVGFVMRLAPLGAFGAMAFTVGRYGVTSLLPLVKMIVVVYATSLVFVALVAWRRRPAGGFLAVETPCLYQGGNSDHVWNLLERSGDAADHDQARMARLPQSRWSGWCCRLATLSISTAPCLYPDAGRHFPVAGAQHSLSITDQIEILLVLMLMSKRVAGVVGIGFVTLAAAVGSWRKKIPVAALSLLIGIDRFMSEARAVTSLIGNIVGTVAVARWVGGLDMAVFRERLAAPMRVAEMVEASVDPAIGGRLSPHQL